ncbi:MAG: 4-hydroxyphenylpyruvate dioxygenase [Pseudomonadota bacterium]|nr:4-hydroxyphenylpyruvate dioxygenase [Pseudomonadota bacterium]
MSDNPLGLEGIEFIEFVAARADDLHQVFTDLGLSLVRFSADGDVRLYQQNDVRFLLNCRAGSVAHDFYKWHGSGVSAVGWRVKDAQKALATVRNKGAKLAQGSDYRWDGKQLPAVVEDVGGALIYFVDGYRNPSLYQRLGLNQSGKKEVLRDTNYIRIDHLAYGIFQEHLPEWTDFYERICGFEKVASFDIRGEHSGMKSIALRSPCGHFSIPINEGVGKKSTINEFVANFKGCGVHHVALLTNDILVTLRELQGSMVRTLAMYPEYYHDVFKRVPSVRENHKEIQKYNVLVDGDEDGYLLQIFSQALIGGLFFEFIQRENNDSYGEGNFKALFRACELDQKKRGYVD